MINVLKFAIVRQCLARGDFACTALSESRRSSARAMKKKTDTLYFGEIRKTVNMPPALWHQIEARMNAYEPPLVFADWARRVFQDELRRPVRVLPDWLAQPKESPGNQNLKPENLNDKVE
jgi:hypothetical protein